MKLPLLLVVLHPALASLCAAESAPQNTSLAALTQGVQTIASPGSPGRVGVFGDAAFPVVVGQAGKTVQPVVGAAEWGQGRVVVFGHGGYFDATTTQEMDSGKFLANCVRWAARGAPQPRVVFVGRKELGETLAALGFSPQAADLQRLSPAEVLVASGRIEAGDVEPLAKFIRAGGGFITADTGWGWKQLNPGKELATDLPVNRLLHAAGLIIADDTLSDTTAGGFSVSPEVLPLAHAGWALAAASAQIGGKGKLNAAEAMLVSATLVGAMENLPPDDALFLPRLRALAATAETNVAPSQKAPVAVDNLAGRLLLTLQGQTLRKLPPEQVRAHPAAEIFPGPVAQTLPRLGNVAVTVDTKVPAWHSTGLYAAPGEIITLTIPAAAAKKKLRVRIGAHKDELWHLDSWKRFPEITREFPLDAATTKAAGAFGGLVYIDVPKDADLGLVAVQISGAVAAPLYVHGKTSAADWRAKIRVAPAPWGELATAKVILTLPSEVLRQLDDPKALMDVWDRVLDLQAELAAIPAERERPERIVCDEQISAGYMHAGYPIMTWLDQPEKFTDRAALLKGNWGIFHELGHNHQVSDWTFEGTGEVTCNLFSLYVFEKLCGVKPREYAHEGKGPIIDLHKKFLAAPSPNFERWKAEPFTALSMYIQMQDAFGWETYQKVFAEYRTLAKEQRPKNDAEKRDQWMTRFSRAAGKNLAPFFRTWGVPVSDEAAKSMSSLPAWMPPGMTAR